MNAWMDDVPAGSMHGRSVVLTGATGGIGQVVAERLSAAGAKVTLAVRDVDCGRRLSASLRRSDVRKLDLADLSTVHRFAAEWRGPIDVLINNAGVMMLPHGTTADGAELQFGVNHLGHFALTNLLLPYITDRVVTVTSKAHMFGRLDLDDPHWRGRRYRPMGAYAQSKLANLLFTQELQTRLSESGSRLAVVADPGFAATGIARHTEHPGLDLLMRLGNRVGAQSAAAGARPVLAAASRDVPRAAWVGPDKVMGMRGNPTLVQWPRSTSDPRLAQRLWALSVQETGVDFTS